jgi:hypothetical protein
MHWIKAMLISLVLWVILIYGMYQLHQLYLSGW